jgi:hypothetical protein
MILNNNLNKEASVIIIYVSALSLWLHFVYAGLILLQLRRRCNGRIPGVDSALSLRIVQDGRSWAGKVQVCCLIS